MQNPDKNLYHVWDKHWKDLKNSDELTFLGRLMFRSKVKVIGRLLDKINVKSVIEVGCGQGHTLLVFCIKGYDVVGIDVSKNAVTVCQNKGLPVKHMSLEEVTDKYDLVSSDGMLEHFLNFEPYAQHMTKISSRYVMLIQPNHESLSGKSLVYLSQLFKKNKNIHEYNYRIKDFISVFASLGFKVVKDHPVFFDVFRLLLFEKKRQA